MSDYVEMTMSIEQGSPLRSYLCYKIAEALDGAMDGRFDMHDEDVVIEINTIVRNHVVLRKNLSLNGLDGSSFLFQVPVTCILKYFGQTESRMFIEVMRAFFIEHGCVV